MAIDRGRVWVCRVALLAAFACAVPTLASAQLVVHRPAGAAAEEDIAPADSPLEPQRQAVIAALKVTPFVLPPEVAQAVAQGDTTALLLAALESARGVHVPRNDALAWQLLQQAAAQYDPRALAAMAVMLANGTGVPRDIGHARDLLNMLERVGFGRAYCMQAEIDARLPGGAQSSRNKRLIAEGAASGDAYCQNLLGVRLELDGDYRGAHDAYAAAAAQGSITASRNLARLAQRASGQQSSLLELQQRAEAGNPQAQFDLARRLHRGVGVPRDFAAALKWYREAAAQLPQAREVLQVILAENGSADRLDPAVMQRLANLPAVADVAMPVVMRSPLRDADALAGLEFVPLQPGAQRLRDMATGHASQVATAPPAAGAVSMAHSAEGAP